MKRSLLVVLSVAFPLFAQFPVDTRPSVSTSGSAEIRVVPDLVEIAVGVETANASLAKARAENDEAIARVIAAAKSRRIDPAKIQTDYVSIEPAYSTQKDRPPVIYTVRKSVVIESNDVAGFEALMSALLDAGANHVHSIQFKTSELRKHRDEARKLAAKAAREKAQLLAESLGRTVGRVRTISEQQDWWGSSYGSWWGRWSSMSQNTFQNAASSGSASAEGTFAPGRISVTATVNVTFELE